MTDSPDSSPIASSDPTTRTAPAQEPPDEVVLRLETRLARAEAQIRTLQEGVADLTKAARIAKQRALYLRIGILLALLGAFFYTQTL